MNSALPWVVLLVVAMFLIVPLLMILSGLVAVVAPRMSWWLNDGWKYKNVEPSGFALVATRLGGVVAIVFGTVFLAVVVLVLLGSVRITPAGQNAPPPAPPHIEAP